MSAHGESHHLRTSDPDVAVALLARSGLAGWVLEPSPGGWTPIVVDRDVTGAVEQRLVDANAGVLALWVLAEDHGFELQLWDGRELVGEHRIEWTFDVEVQARLDVVAASTALGDRVALDWAALGAALDALDGTVEPAAAPAVAAALGLGGSPWLSVRDLREGVGGGRVRRIEGEVPVGRRGIPSREEQLRSLAEQLHRRRAAGAGPFGPIEPR